ncbi:MAG: carbohydrate kinase [Actinobacteria bacterium]|nr:carbohydrate kinase [Actinomycetota bacterium]
MSPDPRDEKFVLVADLGTGGPKVGFVSLLGRVAFENHYVVETRFGPDGLASQDAEEWFRLIVDAAKGALADGVVRPEQVVAVSFTAQWASTVPVFADGTPNGPVIMWMDSRGGREVRKAVGGPVSGYAPRAIAEFIRRSGGAPSLSGADPVGHRLWLHHHEPERWAATRWLLEPVDYLSMRFTGKAAASAPSMMGSWMIDTRDPANYRYDETLLAMTGGHGGKFAPLQRFGTIVGPVQHEVAELIGISNDAVVVTGSPDIHTAALGSGAIGRHEAHMAVSTTGWISAPVAKKKTDLFHQVATIPGLDDENYLIVNNHETAGACFAWLQRILGDRHSYEDLNALAAGSPAGANGVIFTPWLKGERSPIADDFARAGFANLSLGNDTADLVRAVMEGVAINNRWLHDAVEKFAGERLDHIRFIGGGAQSDLWCQIHADVMDRTIEQVADPLYCGLRGAAFSAGIALGEVRRDELRDLVTIAGTYRPNPANRALYERHYKEFKGLYKRQKSFFKRMNRKGTAWTVSGRW